jgi:hypothetical protein
MPSEKASTVTQLIKMPGVIEEAILALKGRQAVVTLGAFVAARDLAIALNLLDKSAIIPEGGPHCANWKSRAEKLQASRARCQLLFPLRSSFFQVRIQIRLDPYNFFKSLVFCFLI